ncbi:MAG: hypothetical protein PHI55_13475 [Burkholderiaceae bacterium]|nr:hypothetical protein [Burkholderiaceae bacterium]
MKLYPDDVLRIAEQQGRQPPCQACAPLACAGWDSFPGTRSDAGLMRVGGLWAPGEDEPTLEEHHPAGTHQWSPQAPIALAYHPANRCEVWQCRACGHPFLRYTEYGGYYEDACIRDLNPDLLVV